MRGIRHWFRGWFGGQQRRALTVAALRYIAHGWPVLPGAWWSAKAGRHVCDIPGCLSAALHPAAIQVGPVAPLIPPANLAEYALTTRREVIDRWSRHLYAILIPTGIACDVLEVPPALAERVLNHPTMRSQSALAVNPAVASLPLAGSPAGSGSIFLFTKADSGLDAESIAMLARVGVVVHSEGSWVPVPPTVVSGETMTWVRTPSDVNWQLPPTTALIPAILESAAGDE